MAISLVGQSISGTSGNDIPKEQRFRVGQWVRVKDDRYGVCRVEKLYEGGALSLQRNGVGDGYYFHPVGQIENWTPRPGERVRVMKCNAWALVGSVGTYCEGYAPEFHGLRVDGEAHSHENYLKSTTEFEPVFEEAESAALDRAIERTAAAAGESAERVRAMVDDLVTKHGLKERLDEINGIPFPPPTPVAGDGAWKEIASITPEDCKRFLDDAARLTGVMPILQNDFEQITYRFSEPGLAPWPVTRQNETTHPTRAPLADRRARMVRELGEAMGERKERK